MSNNITPTLVEKIGRLKENVPCELGDGKVVTLMKCKKGFWAGQDGVFLKKGSSLLVLSEKEGREGQVRYFLNNKESFMEKAIAGTKEEIIKGLEKEVKRLVKTFEDIYSKAHGKFRFSEPNLLSDAILGTYRKENPEHVEFAKKQLEQNPEWETTIASLKEKQDAGDFDSLYTILRTDGLPLLLSVRHKDEKGRELVKRLFSKEHLEETISEVKEKSHLDMVAKIETVRRYDGLF